MTRKKEKSVKEIIPSGISTFRLEASRSRAGMSLIVSGVIGVSDFSDETVVLLSHFGRITVKGRRLFINLYEVNNVELSGVAEEICFKYGKT
jgi:hypothetical protein